MPIKTLFFMIICLIVSPYLCADSASSPRKSKKYMVQKGDSLWTISQATWGNSSKWPLLYAANQEIIKDPNLILPGQEISIPSSIAKGQLHEAMELVLRDFPPRNSSTSSSSVAPNPKSQKPPKEKPVESSAPPSVAPTATEPAREESVSGNGSLIFIVLAVLALGGGLYFWFRKKPGTPPQTQRPEPIASFKTPSTPSFSQPPPTYKPPAQTPAPPPKPIEPVIPQAVPPIPPVADSAAEVYIGQGRFMEAAKIYRAILETDPGNVEIGKKLIRVENMMRTRTAELAAAQPAPKESKPSEPATFSGTMTSISTPGTPPPAQPAPNAPPVEAKPLDITPPPSSLIPSPEIKSPTDSSEPPK